MRLSWTKSSRRKNGAFSQTKVRRQVGGVGVVKDGGMTDGIFSILVDPQIKALGNTESGIIKKERESMKRTMGPSLS